MKKDILLSIFLILMASLLMLSACQSQPPSAVLSDQCRAPCWRQITPGETDFPDAVTLIKKFQDLDARSVGLVDQPRGIFSGHIAFRLTNGEDVSIWAIDSTVVLINFSHTSEGSLALSFGDCIKELGEPTYAIQYSRAGPDYNPFSEPNHYWFAVISPNSGFVFGYDTHNDFEVSDNTQVSYLSYFGVESFDELYQNGFLINFASSEEIPQNRLYKWKGYGDIRKLYPDK